MSIFTIKRYRWIRKISGKYGFQRQVCKYKLIFCFPISTVQIKDIYMAKSYSLHNYCFLLRGILCSQKKINILLDLLIWLRNVFSVIFCIDCRVKDQWIYSLVLSSALVVPTTLVASLLVWSHFALRSPIWSFI